MAEKNDPNERLNAVLKRFGDQVGLTDLSVSEEGVCTLSIDDELLLNLVVNPTADTLIAWMLLGDVPGENRECFLADLLRANLFWHKTKGCTLSLLPDSDTVVVAGSYPMESLGVDRLKSILTEFVEFSDDYLRWLVSLEQPAEAAEGIDEDALRV